MDILKDLSKEKAIKLGKLIPIDITDPKWEKNLHNKKTQNPL